LNSKAHAPTPVPVRCPDWHGHGATLQLCSLPLGLAGDLGQKEKKAYYVKDFFFFLTPLLSGALTRQFSLDILVFPLSFVLSSLFPLFISIV